MPQTQWAGQYYSPGLIEPVAYLDPSLANLLTPSASAPHQQHPLDPWSVNAQRYGAHVSGADPFQSSFQSSFPNDFQPYSASDFPRHVDDNVGDTASERGQGGASREGWEAVGHDGDGQGMVDLHGEGDHI